MRREDRADDRRARRRVEAAGDGAPRARRRRRRGDAQLADQPQQIRPLEAERPGRVRPVAAGALQHRLDQVPLEGGDGVVIPTMVRVGDEWCRRRVDRGVHGAALRQAVCHAAAIVNGRAPRAPALAGAQRRGLRVVGGGQGGRRRAAD
jgi:hypothetical protein